MQPALTTDTIVYTVSSALVKLCFECILFLLWITDSQGTLLPVLMELVTLPISI